MKTKFFSIFIACFIVTSVFSQSSLNEYKYVIVPKKFDFLKEQDQYQLNSLTQFLFNKYGFEALFEGDDYPQDLATNRCLALRSNVLKDSGMFKTKLKVELKDCNDKVVYNTEVGESREKDYKTAYNLALRDAFKSIESLNYKYEPNEKVMALTTPKAITKSDASKEIQELRQEIQNLKKEAEVEKMAAKDIKDKAEAVEESIIEGGSNILYAQEIENGFQLVDSSPKVIYRIKKTNLNNVFLVENKGAVIYKNGEDWLVEYYVNNILKQDILNIKF